MPVCMRAFGGGLGRVGRLAKDRAWSGPKFYPDIDPIEKQLKLHK